MFDITKSYWERFWKVTLILLFLLLSIALIVAWNTPARGYESSIYISTPPLLWVSLISSVIGGVTLVIVSIVKNELSRSYLWKIGFLLVFLSYTVCLSLFIIRGYYMWNIWGDSASHIGWIKEILNTGQFSASLIYPVTHIYLSSVVLLTGLDLIFLHKIVPLVFGLLCILFMYVFAKNLFSNPAGAVLVGIICCCLGLDYYLGLTANGLSNFLIPFALYLMIKFFQKKEWSWAIALSIIIVIYPVFHVISAIILGLVLLTLWIPNKFQKTIQAFLTGKLDPLRITNIDLRLIFPFLLLMIWLIFWIHSFWVFDNTLREMYRSIVLEGKETNAMALVDQISYAQGYGYNVVEQALKLYGADAVLVLLSLLTMFLLWRQTTDRGHIKVMFSLCGPFVLISILMIALFLFNLQFSPFRLMFYISMLGVIFSAYALLYLLNNSGDKIDLVSRGYGFRTTFLILVIFILFLAGMFNLYPSPYNLSMSYHATQMEVTGMTYFYEHRNVNLPLTGITVAPGRFAVALLSQKEAAAQQLPLHIDDQHVPWHFGYDSHWVLSDTYDYETNLIITERDKLMYVDVLPQVAEHRFTNQDFDRLNADLSLNFLYSNGEFDLYLLTPT